MSQHVAARPRGWRLGQLIRVLRLQTQYCTDDLPRPRPSAYIKCSYKRLGERHDQSVRRQACPGNAERPAACPAGLGLQQRRFAPGSSSSGCSSRAGRSSVTSTRFPRAGDYQTFDLGPESVWYCSDRDGSIRGFHNVCRHRGARLLDGSGNCPATITCPYHGWSYRHDGGLVGVPMRESFPGLDRARARFAPGAGGHRPRVRLRVPRRRSAAGLEHLGQRSLRNSRPIDSRTWFR